MYYQARLIDLLDRKFQFVNGLPPSDFLLHLGSFVDFVLTEETIEPHSRRLLQVAEQHDQDYQNALDNIKDQLIRLRRDLVTLFPHADDSKTVMPNTSAFRFSLAHFDDIVCGHPPAMPIAGQGDAYAPPANIEALIGLLTYKVEKLKQDSNSEKLHQTLYELREHFYQIHREHVSYCRLSPGHSLCALRQAAHFIRHTPSHYPSLSALLVDQLFLSVPGHSERSQSRTEALGAASSSTEGEVDHRLLTERLSVLLRCAYEGIRAAIGSHLVHREILSRYKARCMWYDRERIANLAADNPGRREEVLTRDLALYLFDNGISTLYRLKRDPHEFDLVGDQAKARIFVEVKAYKSSKNTRIQLTAGIAQLHAYINALEADALPVTEIYYTVFRMGGPLYDLPLEIPTNRHTFYPIVIDIGSSSESGSRQPPPISIPPSDFFAEMKSS